MHHEGPALLEGQARPHGIRISSSTIDLHEKLVSSTYIHTASHHLTCCSRCRWFRLSDLIVCFLGSIVGDHFSSLLIYGYQQKAFEKEETDEQVTGYAGILFPFYILWRLEHCCTYFCITAGDDGVCCFFLLRDLPWA